MIKNNSENYKKVLSILENMPLDNWQCPAYNETKKEITKKAFNEVNLELSAKINDFELVFTHNNLCHAVGARVHYKHLIEIVKNNKTIYQTDSFDNDYYHPLCKKILDNIISNRN